MHLTLSRHSHTPAVMSPQSSSSLPSSSAAPAVAELVAVGQDAGEEAAAASAEAYEREHVHGVYEAIAPHFSSTRYKPWPAVAQYLNTQRPGAVGLDVGCGNGKYLAVNRSVYMVGSDRSSNLVSLARSHLARGGPTTMDVDAQGSGGKKSRKQPHPRAKQGGKGAGEAADVAKTAQGTETQHEPTEKPAIAAPATSDVLVADGLSLPFRDHSADFVICVAVIHHMSTRARRQDAIRQLLKCVVLPPKKTATAVGAADPDEIIARGGTVLVYVWALEQGKSRRGWDEGGEQDLLVPWVMKKSQAQQGRGERQSKKTKSGPRSGGPVQGPSSEEKGTIAAGAAAVTASGGNDASGEQHEQNTTSPSAGGGSGEGGNKEDINTTTLTESVPDPDPSTVFNRYYHLYRKGELEEDVLAVGGVVVKSGYERDNWWVVCAPGAD